MIKAYPFNYDSTVENADTLYKYDAEFLRNFIKNELTSGIYPVNFSENDPGTNFKVTVLNKTSVNVAPGSAVVDGLRVYSDSDIIITFSSADINGYYDIVIEADFLSQKVEVKKQQRTSNKRNLAMIRTAAKYQICLATVVIIGGEISENVGTLEDTRLNTVLCSDNKPLCGLVTSIYKTDTGELLKMVDDYIQNHYPHTIFKSGSEITDDYAKLISDDDYIIAFRNGNINGTECVGIDILDKKFNEFENSVITTKPKNINKFLLSDEVLNMFIDKKIISITESIDIFEYFGAASKLRDFVGFYYFYFEVGSEPQQLINTPSEAYNQNDFCIFAFGSHLFFFSNTDNKIYKVNLSESSPTWKEL